MHGESVIAGPEEAWSPMPVAARQALDKDRINPWTREVVVEDRVNGILSTMIGVSPTQAPSGYLAETAGQEVIMSDGQDGHVLCKEDEQPFFRNEESGAIYAMQYSGASETGQLRPVHLRRTRQRSSPGSRQRPHPGMEMGYSPRTPVPLSSRKYDVLREPLPEEPPLLDGTEEGALALEVPDPLGPFLEGGGGGLFAEPAMVPRRPTPEVAGLESLLGERRGCLPAAAGAQEST
eukprot:CAMPEP_0175191720 /NCGR_PEP_ID=MMETSP0093-20121207/5086_1 /TAXON_ID=311494 /ORGANISM="Alexandrium monilatum, Strain CCMP3105" /LENGTH=234 /DNA_ID=CAMNT_0016484549 /DNA_START=128 /DNA_END=832 /DNA_ORIENTATION=-